jgi:hypothetical protein
MLVACAEAAIGDPSCEWYTKPPRPGTKAARRYRTGTDTTAERVAAQRRLTGPVCELVGSTESCSGYEDRP